MTICSRLHRLFKKLVPLAVFAISLFVACEKPSTEPPPGTPPPVDKPDTIPQPPAPVADSLDIMSYRPTGVTIHNYENHTDYSYSFEFNQQGRLTKVGTPDQAADWSFTYTSASPVFPSGYTHENETHLIEFNLLGLPVKDTPIVTLSDYPIHIVIDYGVNKVTANQYMKGTGKVHDYVLDYSDTAAEVLTGKSLTWYNEGNVNPISSISYIYADTLNPLYYPQAGAFMLFQDLTGIHELLMSKKLVRHSSGWYEESFVNPYELFFEYTIDSIGRLTSITKKTYDTGMLVPTALWDIHYD